MEHNRICTYPNCDCTDSPHGVCIAREKDCPESPEPSAAEWRERAEKAERERDEARRDCAIFQRDHAKLYDKLNGTPCAEIRWQQERETLRTLIARAVEAVKWSTPAMATLAGYERDYGEALPDDWILGRIEESRDTPSFRIRVGHLRAIATLAADLRKAGEGA